MELSQKLKENLVDSTALLAVTTPICACLENMVLGMTDEVSINARLLATGATYLGFGFLAAKGRDLYKKFLNITDITKESKQQITDSLYIGLCNLVFSPPLYYFSGAHDIKQIMGGTIIGVGVGLLSGGLMGYSIDAYRDMAGIKESARVPECVKKRSKKFKIGFAALITAASIGLTGSIYSITPDKFQEINRQKIQDWLGYINNCCINWIDRRHIFNNT